MCAPSIELYTINVHVLTYVRLLLLCSLLSQDLPIISVFKVHTVFVFLRFIHISIESLVVRRTVNIQNTNKNKSTVVIAHRVGTICTRAAAARQPNQSTCTHTHLHSIHYIEKKKTKMQRVSEKTNTAKKRKNFFGNVSEIKNCLKKILSSCISIKPSNINSTQKVC